MLCKERCKCHHLQWQKLHDYKHEVIQIPKSENSTPMPWLPYVLFQTCFKLVYSGCITFKQPLILHVLRVYLIAIWYGDCITIET